MMWMGLVVMLGLSSAEDGTEFIEDLPLASPASSDAHAPVERTLSARVEALDLAWPIRAEHRVSAPFGDRRHPILGDRRHHNGIDLAVPTGTNIYAPAAGVIVGIDENTVSGRFVTLDHGDGVQTVYAHLHGVPAVPLGTPVRRGQRFASVGNTGRSTGPHLHYMLTLDGVPIDPVTYERPVAPPAPSRSVAHAAPVAPRRSF